MANAPVVTARTADKFIALTVGNGGPHPVTRGPLIPEVRNLPDRSATLCVFELPDRAANR